MGDKCVNVRVAGRAKDKEYYKEYHKEYDKNRDKNRGEYYKEYYENNKEKIMCRMREVIECECGLESTRGNILRHKGSNRHAKRMHRSQN